MKRIITLGDADVIDIKPTDKREDFEILGVSSVDEVEQVNAENGRITYVLCPSETAVYNLTASLLSGKEIYGEALFEAY